MSKTYILVDTANLFFRARHVVRGDLEEKIGMCLHVTLNSVRKAWKDFNGKHVIFCLEGRSWRKDVYEPYKRNRAEVRAAMTVKEQEEDKLFWETFDALKTFISENTNCTVLRHENLEADDLVAGWIQSHPDDEHIIVSSDTDFHQLLADNVKQYNVDDYVEFIQMDYNDWLSNPEDFDLMHLDISNTGDTILETYNILKDKIAKGSVVLFEGGSEERDNVEWMIKYKATPMLSIQNKTNYKIINPNFPSISVLKNETI